MSAPALDAPARALVALASRATFWLPRRSSSIAADVDWNWNLVYWVSVFFFALVTFLMVFFAVRYRARPGRGSEPSTSHNTPLEIVWSVIPTMIVVVMFWNGYRTYLDLATPPQNAYDVQVEARRWSWQFIYPNGYIDSDLHVPRGTPIRLTMNSVDVIHSFFVPEFRVKRDVIPGRYTKLWFTALENGEYDIFCAEYCGKDHSAMLAKVRVHDPQEFESWLAEASDFLKRLPPAEAGQKLYEQRGCKQCHSVDGRRGTGPSFLGLWGTEEQLAGGERVPVDENYVRESILLPQARVTAGYEPVMPTYSGRLTDQEISAIIAYLKTLSEG